MSDENAELAGFGAECHVGAYEFQHFFRNLKGYGLLFSGSKRYLAKSL